MSGTLAACIFLPLPPLGVAAVMWRGRRRTRRRLIEDFAEQVEFQAIVRNIHG